MRTLLLSMLLIGVNFLNCEAQSYGFSSALKNANKFNDLQYVKTDSIKFVRRFLTFETYQDDRKLSPQEVKGMLVSAGPDLRSKYIVGTYLRPTAVLVASGGAFLIYDGLKGTEKTGLVRGQEYPYTSRSLPKLLAGIGLFVAGGCLFEFGNDLKAKSVNGYNRKIEKELLSRIQLGITPGGRVGTYLSF